MHRVFGKYADNYNGTRSLTEHLRGTSSKWAGKSLFLVSIVGFLTSSSAWGATYYVGKTGKDSHSCTQAQSPTTPKLTIQAGVLCARAGDSVLVKAGAYTESVNTWPASGTSTAPITVAAHPGDTVTWSGGSASALYLTSRSYIRISGFTFANMRTRVTLRLFNPTGNRTANPMVGIEILNNTFLNNGVTGLPDANSSTTLLIQGIGRGAGYTGAPVNRISGNTFTGNYGADITLAGSSDTAVDHNASTGLQGSKDSSNGGNFVARFLLLTGQEINGIWNKAERNVIEQNTVSDIQRGSYVNYTFEGAGIRMDSDADANVVRANVIHDILSGVSWDWSQRGFGVHIESRCDQNQVIQNIVYNVSEACYQIGSEATTVAVGNQLLNNVGHHCDIAGLIVANAREGVFKNNTFYDNGHSQVYVTTTSVAQGGHVFAHNNYTKTGSAAIGVWNWKTTGLPYPPASQSLSQWKKASGETE